MEALEVFNPPPTPPKKVYFSENSKLFFSYLEFWALCTDVGDFLNPTFFFLKIKKAFLSFYN